MTCKFQAGSKKFTPKFSGHICNNVYQTFFSYKCINNKEKQEFLSCHRSQSNILINGQFLDGNNCTHVHVELTAGVGGHVHVD